MLSQWIALGVFMLMVGGLTYAFVCKGVTIRPDPENKPPSDGGGRFPRF
jgi:hypothetical protein